MIVDYPALIEHLTRDEKLIFYGLLARNLTIANRSVWSDGDLAPTEQIERMKWLIEVTHRVLNRLTDLLQNQDNWSEKDVWDLIAHHAAQNSAVGADVGFTIEHSYAGLLKYLDTKL